MHTVQQHSSVRNVAWENKSPQTENATRVNIRGKSKMFLQDANKTSYREPGGVSLEEEETQARLPMLLRHVLPLMAHP